MRCAVYSRVVSLMVASLLSPGVLVGAVQGPVLQLAVVGDAAGSIGTSSPGISCATACSAAVLQGEAITLLATPAPGNAFESWAGDCAGLQPTCTLRMDAGKLAVASFKRTGDPYTVIHRFLPNDGDGLMPGSGALLEYDGFLYGMTPKGGRGGRGTIFRELPDGTQHTVLHDFLGAPVDGSLPYGSLTEHGGTLYGMTLAGGNGGCTYAELGSSAPPSAGCGTVFAIDPDGSGFAILYSFSGGASDGMWPRGSLVASGGALFGMTQYGTGTCKGSWPTGIIGCGTVFRIYPDGSGFAVLHSFAAGATDGQWPQGSLIDVDGVLYGMTSQGGSGGCTDYTGATIGCGAIFKVKEDGSAFSLLHSFAGWEYPRSSLVVVGNVLYGMTPGGSSGGELFKINLDGTAFALVHSFGGGTTEGSEPSGSLIAFNGALFGTTMYGGAKNAGTIFKVRTDGSGFTLLHSFFPSGWLGSESDGDGPQGSLVVAGGRLHGMTQAGGVSGLGTVFGINDDGSGFALLHSFAATADADGAQPTGSLTALGTELYGISYGGGVNGAGTAFKVNSDGTGFAVLHSFGSGNGSNPIGSLTASGGEFFGMTHSGGASGTGTIFRINADGSSFQLLHSFGSSGQEWGFPSGSLTVCGAQLCGMTPYGGESGGGTIFTLNRGGTGFRVIHSFSGYFSDGEAPGGSLLDLGGTLYGTTSKGVRSGTIFRINPDGSAFALLYSFGWVPPNAGSPAGSLTASNGVFFGTTSAGGAGDRGAIFKVSEDGSNFGLVHEFTDAGTGRSMNPVGTLVALGGVLYGTTPFGGDGGCLDSLYQPRGCGVIFKVNEDGSGYAVVHSFAGNELGFINGGDSFLTPVGGSLYGVTPNGDAFGLGVIYRVDVPQRRVRHHLSRL